jgi:hypothetical protein
MLKNVIPMRTLCLIAFTFILGSTTLSAQEANTSETLKHEVGLAAGFSTGYGLSYRYWPQQLGVQLTAAPFFSNDESNVSLGITGLYSLRSAKYYRFFLYYGNHFLFEKTPTYYSFYDPTQMNTVFSKETKRDFTWITGAGPGIEIIAWGRVGFNAMFGLAYYNHGSADWKVTMTVESGMYFKL